MVSWFRTHRTHVSRHRRHPGRQRAAMSKARLVITAVVIEKRPVAEVATSYGVSRSWIYELLARHRDEGDAAFEPRSRRGHTSPGASDPATVDPVLRLRKQLAEAGHDAGAGAGLAPDPPPRHRPVPSRHPPHPDPPRSRHPEPKKKPRSSYIRFEAAMPNECWQSDFTHYPLTDTDARLGHPDCSARCRYVALRSASTGSIRAARIAG